jgi:hypothetical protein
MGQPAAFFTVNGTKHHSHAPGPRWAAAGVSPEQCRTQFWTERLEALKRRVSSPELGISHPERPATGLSWEEARPL